MKQWPNLFTIEPWALTFDYFTKHCLGFKAFDHFDPKLK
jgi:hypothetical protein